MPNRLAESNSPYLLQHKDNPVNWYPWDAMALEIAEREQRPIFLSIGYAACHWCHVMERESFEDSEIAKILNEHFVSIKVDREERPDIDQIYMRAVQAMTGRGGWPMSMFLTSAGDPFYGGTYFPPSSRMGMPGFKQVLEAVIEAWNERGAEVVEQARKMTSHLNASLVPGEEERDRDLDRSWIANAVKRKQHDFDRKHGGFGNRPKFPHPSDLQLLLRHANESNAADFLHIVEKTLSMMARGGIYDHVGGGFARYSVDEKWLVPHFEKMLYDNALLATVYLQTHQATGHKRYARVAEQTLSYLMRDMQDAMGGFHSSEDADSEGVEGKFYVWTPDEICEVLGQERGRNFCAKYDVSDLGNFEGVSIPNLLQTDSPDEVAEYSADAKALLEARSRRTRPNVDDKVLVNWNAYAIDALALGSQVLGRDDMTQAAESAAEFIWRKMRDEHGRLLHAYRRGQSHLKAYQDDYAALLSAYVTLYEITGVMTWLRRAEMIADQMIEKFEDPTGGGFFYTGSDHEKLIVRTKDFLDGSTPSGNGLAALGLLRLSRLTNNETFERAAMRTLQAGVNVMQEQAPAAASLLIALDFATSPTEQFAFLDPSKHLTPAIREAYFKTYRPNAVIAFGGQTNESPGNCALLDGKRCESSTCALYVCQQFTCEKPLVGLPSILARLSSQSDA